MSHERIRRVEDVVRVNDSILVKCIGIDNQGRVDLRKMDSDENNIVNNDIDKNNEKYDWFFLKAMKQIKQKVNLV